VDHDLHETGQEELAQREQPWCSRDLDEAAAQLRAVGRPLR
jgi:hypothetical protein